MDDRTRGGIVDADTAYLRAGLAGAPVASKRVAILGERYGAAGRDLAKATNGRLDMQGHNMMQEQVAFGDDADDGRD